MCLCTKLQLTFISITKYQFPIVKLTCKKHKWIFLSNYLFFLHNRYNFWAFQFLFFFLNSCKRDSYSPECQLRYKHIDGWDLCINEMGISKKSSWNRIKWHLQRWSLGLINITPPNSSSCTLVPSSQCPFVSIIHLPYFLFFLVFFPSHSPSFFPSISDVTNVTEKPKRKTPPCRNSVISHQ